MSTISRRRKRTRSTALKSIHLAGSSTTARAAYAEMSALSLPSTMHVPSFLTQFSRILVSRPRGPFTKAFDRGKDVIGGFGPDEGLRIAVADVDVVADCGLEFEGAAMRPASQLAVGGGGKEALDLVDPRGTGGREVQLKAGMTKQPALDERRLVGAVVVEDEMDVECSGNVGVDGVEELPEFDAAMPSVMLGDDLAGLDVQGGEERGRAVADVVVGTTLDLAGAQGQDRLRAVQGLDLRLFVHAQNQGPIRRVEIQPNDVANLFDQERVGGKLEALRAMRPETKRPPDPMNGTAAQSGCLRQRACAPVRRVLRFGLQRPHHHTLHLRVRDAAGSPWPWLIQQPVEPTHEETRTPLPARLLGQPQFLRSVLDQDPLGHRQLLRRGSDHARSRRLAKELRLT